MGETFCGLDGLRRASTGFVEPYAQMIYDLERIVSAGNEFVSIHRVRSKARYTGIAQEFSIAYVWTYRDGLLVHAHGFLHADEALKAMGLAS